MTYMCDTVELKKAMTDAGIKTNVELSSKSGIDRNTIGEVLNGKKKPSTEVMYKLVAALNLTPERAGQIFFASNLRTA